MSLFDYYVALRSDILEIITGVENATSSLFWDNTTANYITKNRLQNLFAKYVAAAKQFGLLVVIRHAHCPNTSHIDYLTSNSYGLHIPYLSVDYVWNGGQFYQGSRLCACPCSKGSGLTEHHVIEDIVYDRRANHDICTKLELILDDIFEAIDSAGDKKPRSAIREYLLRAILRINDELLPQPMDKYIRDHH